MTLKISPEMTQKLKDMLQKEAFFQLSEQMKYNLKKNNMAEGDLYDPILSSNGVKAKTDRNKFHGDFLRAWKLKITSHNPMLFQPSLLKKLQLKLGIVPSDSALWLAICFYQFFIIDMVKYDILYEYNSKHLNLFELEEPEDMLKSFAHFRRGIELLYAPIALPLASFDHSLFKFVLKSMEFDNHNTDFKQLYSKEQRILLNIWTTEGFHPIYGNWLESENAFYYFKNYGEMYHSLGEALASRYDTYAILSIFFVALFGDEADKILKSHKYSFTKEYTNGQRSFNNFLKMDTLLDFFCKDFPNAIAKKTFSLLSNLTSPSSTGWKIYTTVKEITRNYATGSAVGIDYNFSKLISLLTYDSRDWLSWYHNATNSSKTYSYWKNELNLNQSLITYDELNDLFNISK